MAQTKIVDGQNISLVDALSRYGLQATGTNQGEFEVKQDGKKFVLSNLTGTVKEIPVLEGNDENIQGGNDTSNLKQASSHDHHTEGHKDRNGDTILNDGQVLEKHSIDSENARQTKALEQNGFHVVGDDGYQSSSTGNSNKESGKTGGTIITPRDDGRPGLKLEKEQDNEETKKKSNRKA